MKFIVSAIVLSLVYASVMSVSCIATNYCMGCHATTANECVSCFNWGTGTVGARALNTTPTPSNCQTAIVAAYKTANAQEYIGTNQTSQSTTSVTDVRLCRKDFKNFTQTGTVLACSDTAITLTSVTAVKIDNCHTVVAYDSTSGTDDFGCQHCDKKYGNSGAWSATSDSIGSRSCAKYSGIANCDYPFKTNSTTWACRYCKSKYAVSNAGNTCTSYTADSNCAALQSGNTTCRTCWSAYYWDASKCKLAAQILIAGAMAVGSLLI